MQSSCIPPAPARGEIRRFPLSPAHAAPVSDRVVVFHQGRAVAFDTPADMHQAVIDARLPEIRHRAAEVERTLAQAQALTARAQETLDATRAQAEANAVRHRDQLVHTAILAFAAGVGLMILLGGGL